MTETTPEPTTRRIEPWALVPVAIIVLACIPLAIIIYLSTQLNTASYDTRHYLRMENDQEAGHQPGTGHRAESTDGGLREQP